VRGHRRRIVVYDPNHMNPYGVELACLLAEARSVDVRAYVAVDLAEPYLHASAYGSEIRILRKLARGRAAASPLSEGAITGKLAVLIQRFLGPCRAALGLNSGDTVVVVWLRDRWEKRVFDNLVARGIDVIHIDHNPLMSGRSMGQLRLKPGARRVVHSELLRDSSTDSALVVGHLLYQTWVRAHGDVLAAGALMRQQRKETIICILGELRPDKGAEELGGLLYALRNCQSPLRLFFTTSRPLDQVLVDSLTKGGIAWEQANASENNDCCHLAEQLSVVDLLLAPYTAATQSGSVLLAFALNVPVLGYDSGALREILSARSMVNVNDQSALSQRICEFADLAWSTWNVSAEGYQRQIVRSWFETLGLPEGFP
jgi:hypothetical protein